MKYVLMVVIIILALGGLSVAQAAGPYLVCDPYAASYEVTSFVVFWDGSTTGVTVPAYTDATGTYLRLDISPVANGAHTVKVRSKNLWGESVDSDPFAFVKQGPAKPLNIRIKQN